MIAISKEQMADSGKFFVLIADEDAASRTQLASRIHRLGHAIATAASGTEAWEVFESMRPNLVVASCQMPGIDGITLSKRIRATVGDDCFIILMAERDANADAQSAIAAGADDLLTKPVTLDEFRGRVVVAEHRLALARVRMRLLAGI
jgi:CheY-like chemotaxis protein